MNTPPTLRTARRADRPLGVIYSRGQRNYRICGRCGIERESNMRVATDLCADCRAVDGWMR